MRIHSLTKFQAIAILFLAFICISFAFSFLVIKNFSAPLIGRAGPGKIDNWDYLDYLEYMGFYFAKNLSFIPFPKLNLVNNQVFYPYGTNSVFQAWAIERDFFYSILYSLFGIGPWLQIYYLLSVLLTAIGTLTLLIRDYGLIRASGAGFIVSFFNFYAINKYPHHINHSVLHWTILSLITDFLIVKRVVLRQPVCLRLILVRGCLLILSIGHDLGYVAGFALMSFTVSLFFIVVLLSSRYFRRELKLTDFFYRTLKAYKTEFFAYNRTSLFLLILGILVAYINVPLVYQISIEAKSFDFSEVPSGGWWTNPLRLLIPFFPVFNPGVSWELFLEDSPEGLGAGSPGVFLLILGTVGLWQARKRLTIFIPLLTIFILCLLYHPEFFPTLKIFPWFSFNRVGGRSTVIYPVILCLFALEINFHELFNRLGWFRRQLLSVLVVGIACTELYTAYSFKLDYQPYSLDKNFFAYMNYVKKQPGEAVLDWPFCAIGGNGVGINLCPYYALNSGVFGMRRFHEKKVMGQYFGRLHPSQIEPYLKTGWDKLLLPGISDTSNQTPQVHCFRPVEWSFFTDFYKFNDFAGINLYVDLLPEDCVTKFYDRFGKPVAETLIPGPGRVKFIPKSPELRNQVNLALGATLKLKQE